MSNDRKSYRRTPGARNVPDMALAREELGRRLRAARERAHLTQQEVADQLHIDWRVYQRWDTGKAAPRSTRIPELAQVLGVEVAYLEEPHDEHLLDRLERKIDDNARILRTTLGLLDQVIARLDALTPDQAQPGSDDFVVPTVPQSLRDALTPEPATPQQEADTPHKQDSAGQGA